MVEWMEIPEGPEDGRFNCAFRCPWVEVPLPVYKKGD